MATGNEKEEEPKIKLRNYVPEETSNFEYTKVRENSGRVAPCLLCQSQNN